MKLTLVMGDDWTGLYIDDELVIENHSLHERHVLEAIQEKCGFELDVVTPNENWLEERGSLPDSLKDVKKRKTK